MYQKRVGEREIDRTELKMESEMKVLFMLRFTSYLARPDVSIFSLVFR